MINFINVCICAIISISIPIQVDINDYVLSYQGVLDGGVLVQDNEVLVAIITTPLFSRSEIIIFKEKLENDIIERYNYKKIFISFDAKLVYQVQKAISCDSNSDTIRQLIEIAKSRNC